MCLTVRNPGAIFTVITHCVIEPIGGHLPRVAKKIYLSLGSNLGRRRANLQQAINALGEFMAFESISSIYETTPWGFSEQPDFLNICIAGRTSLEPAQFLTASKAIEKRMGRNPGRRWGPRTIDIDILYIDSEIVDKESLKVPHPALHERAFVLVPLNEIAPAKVDPRSKKTVKEMAESQGDDNESVRKIKDRSLRRPIHLAWGIKTYVMGIINTTPDSFSGDGIYRQTNGIEAAINQAIHFVDLGADLLDIGGESTRPGSVPISAELEIKRVIPVIKAIRERVDVPISVDTYRATVANAALKAGADWINDVWGLRMDPDMALVAAESNCPIIIMHNRSKPKDVEQQHQLGGRYVGVMYDDLLADVKKELRKSISIALNRGCAESQIILDPGLGFGKTIKQNLKLIHHLDEIKELGYPLLIGPSRKSFVGYTLDLAPYDRIEGTSATVAIGIDRGADIVRVHDVKEMARVARMTDQIVRTTFDGGK